MSFGTSTLMRSLKSQIRHVLRVIYVGIYVAAFLAAFFAHLSSLFFAAWCSVQPLWTLLCALGASCRVRNAVCALLSQCPPRLGAVHIKVPCSPLGDRDDDDGDGDDGDNDCDDDDDAT